MAGLDFACVALCACVTEDDNVTRLFVMRSQRILHRRVSQEYLATPQYNLPNVKKSKPDVRPGPN